MYFRSNLSLVSPVVRTVAPGFIRDFDLIAPGVCLHLARAVRRNAERIDVEPNVAYVDGHHWNSIRLLQ